MLANYEESLHRLLLSEGGYTNHPSDPGGPTNFGITLVDAQKYAAEFHWIVGRKVTAADVKAMPLWFAKMVYDAKYWDSLRCDELPHGVDYAVFDYGVNSGIGRSGKVLRRVLGVSDSTYVVSDSVIAAVRLVGPEKVINAICDERLRFLKNLKTWPVFGGGWEARVRSVRAASLQMAAAGRKAAPTVAPAPSPVAIPLEPSAKGTVAPPTAIKGVIKTGTPTVGAGVGAGFQEWVFAHPWETGAIAAAGVVGIGIALYGVNRWHRSRQESPAPGWQSPNLMLAAA